MQRSASYSASTGSSHSFEAPSTTFIMAICAKSESGAAPCQCLVSGTTYTTSPGLSSTGSLPPLLVVAAPAHGDENLAGLVMNMPVITAARLERDVGNVDFLA